EAGREGAARHHAGLRPFDLDRVAVARHSSLGHFETDEPPGGPCLLLFEEGLSPHEVALVELHCEAETCLERGDLLGKLIAVKGKARLEPEGVPGAETDGNDPEGATRLHEAHPDR